jgi:hypothetical protein
MVSPAGFNDRYTLSITLVHSQEVFMKPLLVGIGCLNVDILANIPQ